LGEGLRMPQGWRLEGVAGLATNSTVRARGVVTGGEESGSSWFVETRLSISPMSSPQFLREGLGFPAAPNLFHMKLRGLLGQTVVLEASANLQDWSTIATDTFTQATLEFTDPLTPDMNPRFYRVRLK